MKVEIQKRTATNLDRVRSFLELYDGAKLGSGRPSVGQSDLLRAAVVFLHASLEDLLRSALEWKWPQTCVELEEVAFSIGGRPEKKIDVATLATLRPLTTVDVVANAVTVHLELSSFNNVGDVKKALRRMGVAESALATYQPPVIAMIARRHQIVHRADRHDAKGTGHHAAASISRKLVGEWTEAVSRFAGALIAVL